MSVDYGTRMFVAGFKLAFDLHARNGVTGERRELTVYANDAAAAYAEGFRKLDAESGNRTWYFDGYDVRER